MTAENKRFPLDFKICAVIFVIAAFLFMESRSYAAKAAMFPGIMLACIMILSVYIMMKSCLEQRGNRQATASLESRKAKNTAGLKAVFVFGGMTTLYALVTPYLSFGLSSLLFLGAGMVFFGERDKLAVTVAPTAVMVFVYAFFVRFLDVGVPFFPNLH